MEPRIDPLLSIRLSFGFHSIFGGNIDLCLTFKTNVIQCTNRFLVVDSTIFGCNAYHILIYTLWLFNIAMENGIDGLLKMVIFHGYVKYPSTANRPKKIVRQGLGFFQ